MQRDARIKKALGFAAETERLAGKFYRQMAERFSDDVEVEEVFSVLANDEMAHEKHCQSLLGKLPAVPEGPDLEDRFVYLQAMSLSDFFHGEDDLDAAVAQIHNRQDALERAFRLEQATLSYYYAMFDVLQQNDVIEGLVKAEKRHLLQVMKYMIAESKVRGIFDDF